MMKYEYNREKAKAWFEKNMKNIRYLIMSSNPRIAGETKSFDKCNEITGEFENEEKIQLTLNFDELCVHYMYLNHRDELKAKELSAELTNACREKKKRQRTE